MVHLDYRDVRPIYAQIADGLKEQIRTGILAPGDKLPSVRELATTLTINPNTIQRAYAALEAEGFIASVTGKGSFVCEQHEAYSPEQAALLRIFDETAAKLLRTGITTDALTQRLKEGGDSQC